MPPSPRSDLDFRLAAPIGAGDAGFCSELAHVRQSIQMILSTRPGTRPLEPDFGCRIHELLFSPMTMATLARIRLFVEQALERWEPRIQNVEVQLLEEQPDRFAPARHGFARIQILFDWQGAQFEQMVRIEDGLAWLESTPTEGF